MSWTYDIPDPWGILDYRPVLGADGTVYQQTPVGALVSLSPDGELRWNVSLGCCGPDFGQGAVPALAPGGEQIYVVATSEERWGGREIRALRVGDGSCVWSFPSVTQNASGYSLSSHSPTVGGDGTIYVLLSDAGIVALRPEDGSPVWSEPLRLPDNPDQFRAAISRRTLDGVEEELLVVSSCGDEGLLSAYAVNGSLPELMWNISVDGEPGLLMEGCPVASPVIGEDGTVYLVTNDRSVSAWTMPGGAGEEGGKKWIMSLPDGSRINAEPAVPPGIDTVLFGSENHKVYALYASTGKERWTFETGGYVTASPAVSQDGSTAYVGSYDGCFYALSVADRSVRWQHREVFVFAASAAAGPDGRVFAGSGNGTLFAFAPAGALETAAGPAAVLA